jgi:antitoxin ParD1/3/4
MEVILKPEMERFVAEKMKAGQYASASELVNEALEVLWEQEEFSPEHEAYLRNELRRGIEQLDAGLGEKLDIERIIAEEHERAASRKKAD